MVVKNFKTLYDCNSERLICKSNLEHELVEKFRNYCRQRCLVEQQYFQSLQKLSNDFKLEEDRCEDLGFNERSIFLGWNNYLNNVRTIGGQHKQIAKQLSDLVDGELKEHIFSKHATSKKTFQFLRRIHNEMQLAAKDLDKAKKTYIAANGGLKSNRFSFMSRKSTNEDLPIVSVDDGRNDYVINVVAMRAHIKRYRTIDLEKIIEELEHNTISLMSMHLTSIIDQEKSLTEDSLKRVESLYGHLQQINSPEEHRQAFKKSHDSLKWPLSITFDPHPADKDFQRKKKDNTFMPIHITVENQGYWEKEAKSYISSRKRSVKKIAGLEKELEHLNIQLQQLQTLRASVMSSKQLATFRESLEGMQEKIDAKENEKRIAETSLWKCREILEHFESYGMPIKALESRREVNRTKSTASEISHYRTPHTIMIEQSTFGGQANSDSNDASSEDSNSFVFDTEDQDEGRDDNREGEESGAGDAEAAAYYIAMYEYEGQNEGELTFEEGELFTMIEDPKLVDWAKAINYKGEVGFVPSTYVRPHVMEGAPSYDREETLVAENPHLSSQSFEEEFDTRRPSKLTNDVQQLNTGFKPDQNPVEENHPTSSHGSSITPIRIEIPTNEDATSTISSSQSATTNSPSLPKITHNSPSLPIRSPPIPPGSLDLIKSDVLSSRKSSVSSPPSSSSSAAAAAVGVHRMNLMPSSKPVNIPLGSPSSPSGGGRPDSVSSHSPHEQQQHPNRSSLLPSPSNNNNNNKNTDQHLSPTAASTNVPHSPVIPEIPARSPSPKPSLSSSLPRRSASPQTEKSSASTPTADRDSGEESPPPPPIPTSAPPDEQMPIAKCIAKMGQDDRLLLDEEDLLFHVGDTIEILDKHPNGLDDGYWMGRIGNRVGMLNSMLVKEIK